MKKPPLLQIAALSLGLVLALPGSAQQTTPHHGHHPPGSGHGGAPAQPYSGLERREIKALSDENRTALLEGRGMSLALAAELNGYPGPLHVLEHAEAVRLTSAQRATAEELRVRMDAEARILGSRIVALEEALDRLFATGAAEPASLAALTAAIGALNGRLREVHLTTHIAMREALTPEQRALYARARGYAAR